MKRHLLLKRVYPHERWNFLTDMGNVLTGTITISDGKNPEDFGLLKSIRIQDGGQGTEFAFAVFEHGEVVNIKIEAINGDTTNLYSEDLKRKLRECDLY